MFLRIVLRFRVWRLRSSLAGDSFTSNSSPVIPPRIRPPIPASLYQCLVLRVIWHPTASRPVCPSVRSPSWIPDHFFFPMKNIFWQSRVFHYLAPSLTKRRACLIRSAFLETEFRRTHDRILRPQMWGSLNLKDLLMFFFRRKVAQLYPQSLDYLLVPLKYVPLTWSWFCDRRSFGMCVVVLGNPWGPLRKFWMLFRLTVIWFFTHGTLSDERTWLDFIAIIQWFESHSNRNHASAYHLRPLQPWTPGTLIYIPQEQGWPIVPRGRWPLRRRLQLSGLRLSYSN